MEGGMCAASLYENTKEDTKNVGCDAENQESIQENPPMILADALKIPRCVFWEDVFT